MNPHADALQLEWVGGEFMLRWLGRVPGVTITAFGGAAAVRCPAHGDVDFLNTVHRLLPDDAGQVPLIAEHYRAAGVPAWLELMPAPDFERLAEALGAAGARQVGFLTVQERELTAPLPGPPPAGLAIEGALIQRRLADATRPAAGGWAPSPSGARRATPTWSAPASARRTRRRSGSSTPSADAGVCWSAVGEVKILLNLPQVGSPPWWMTRGDRQCWYTLEALLQQTMMVVTPAR